MKLTVTALESRDNPSAYALDFGTATSPVESGFTRVTASDSRWTGDALDFDRGPGTSLTRDFVYATDATLNLSVANGTYTVSATMGDTGPYSHDLQALWLEGSVVEVVNTVGGEVVTVTRTVQVADGSLTVRIQDQGGTNPHAVLMGLTVTPNVPPPPPSATHRLDFGTATSPVGSGFTRVTHTDPRWTGDALSFDRGIGTSTNRDFVYATDATFRLAVPNGTHQVTVTLGDAGPYVHDNQRVSFEGVLTHDVTTGQYEVTTLTSLVTVTDGELTMRLWDVGGVNPHAVIQSLTVGPAAPAAPRFDVTLNFTGVSAAYQRLFRHAADRWEELIVGDLPDVAVSPFGPVDDVRIDVYGSVIDGPFGVLGGAASYLYRNDATQLPYYGFAEFDVADLDRLAAEGRLYSVVVHEFAHALGFGVSWAWTRHVSGNTFTGSNAVAEYGAPVPLETGGGLGTAGSHWSESVFGNELMTGWLNQGTNPLSRLTVAAFADMGYVVDFTRADPY